VSWSYVKGGSNSGGFAFKFKHFLFEGDTTGSGEAAHFAVTADYTMAGDNQRQWIFSKCAADGSGGVGSA
jgi:hypothetical protein